MTARKSHGGVSTWWKPPGLMEISDADLLNASTSFSVPANARGGLTLHTSKVAQRASIYVTAPDGEQLSTLYQLTRRATMQTMRFSTQHTALCLQLLDVLAEHALTVAKTVESGASLPPVRLTEMQQLLDLLYLFPRHTAIGYPSHTLGKLLQWLVKSIVAAALRGAAEHNDTVLKLQLLVLAEMLKINAGVRIYIKEMPKIKEFYRGLTILLNSTEDAEFLVYSMVILARLVLSDSLGAKLFSLKNVDQALELVFSVLEGTWDGGEGTGPSASGRLGDLLQHTSVLQCLSVDLLCELAERSDILSGLEKYPKVVEMAETMVGVVHLNGNAQQIHVAVHYLGVVVGLGHLFRKGVIQHLSEHDNFHRLLQVVLHPSKLLAFVTAELLLKIMGDDFRPLRGLFESSLQTQQLGPIIAGLFRLLSEASTVVQQSESVEELRSSEEYLLSVHVSQLLTKLCEFPLIRALCVETVSLNQTASVIQVESSHINSLDPQALLHYQPILSIHIVMLLSSLLRHESMDEKNKRTLSQFLQSSEVATVLGSAFFNRTNKDLVVETLLLYNQYLSGTTNKRFYALSLADGVLIVGQRLNEANENMQSIVGSLEANVAAHTKTIEKLQTDLQQALRFQDESRARHDLELQEIKGKYVDQLRQKEDAAQKIREMYDVKIRELNAQCESMAQLMTKKISALQHREQMLQENRNKRSMLEEENTELKRKVQVLEVRLEEVAHAHSIGAEEMRLRDKEIKSLQEEMAALSHDYTSQREEIERAHDVIKNLETQVHEGSQSQESTFKELVLLSKAHKALGEEKDELHKEVDAMRDELSNLESLNITIQTRLQEKKEVVEQLERKAKRMEDASSMHQSALEDEREKRRSMTRDFEEMRKAHRKLESDVAMAEIRMAEMRIVIESRDEQIRKGEEEIRHLTNEVNKQSKLQALIHQLSSGGDPQALATGAFLARDS
ncbi:hypothetical protein Poli38472_002074 [Pythium oligandrum]|uniref:CIP2A N-terminal domain-containing protein n=1 Tax=Pythium oligandrum TaxID=41045 RepID=A0A8K1FLX8_PYTOL|nr:hypothetical protein Poli38472_002074 [Pythium oligandrum]|eukprot:TMW63133.1 hypothetical protein Poli38472_002074 [Pythium oligandrum]